MRLPGVGPVTAERLAERGLRCVRDLAEFLPTGYDDFRRVTPLPALAGLPDGTMVLVRGNVSRVRPFFRRLLDVYVESEDTTLRARWFHPPGGMSKRFTKGAVLSLAGRLHRGKDGVSELIQPSVFAGEGAEDEGLGIVPRYPRVEGVPGKRLRDMLRAAAEVAVRQSEEFVSPAVRARLGLPDYADAIRTLHTPGGQLDEASLLALREGRSGAHRRLVFERMVRAQVLSARARKDTAQHVAMPCPVVPGHLDALLGRAFPFLPTKGQREAIAVLVSDLAEPVPMSKLLVGDVGCGKTAVAFAAMAHVAAAGGQSLFLAPTTVLAEQHFRTLSSWASGVDLRVGLLTGDTDACARSGLLAKLAEGTVDVLVGTHALLDARVAPRRYALAIVDEQHRFGVRQRLALRRLGGRKNEWQSCPDGGMVPHLLVMSATPIPRSMALALHGDLEMLVIPDKPAGRRPIATYLALSDAEREQAFERLASVCAEGGQGFVVCPAIDEDDDGRSSVTAMFQRLRRRLAPHRTAMVHGRMPAAQVEGTLADFAQGKVHVLLSTTVLEVGVDAPNARIMVVMDAERFGLSQLHQLRGRVGRGGEPSECHLVAGTADPAALGRLAFVADNHDGFRIAEEDLRQRGAGDYWGIKQSGGAMFSADMGELGEMLEFARREAEAILAREPALFDADHPMGRWLVHTDSRDAFAGETG